jgi:hypothetical protein
MVIAARVVRDSPAIAGITGDTAIAVASTHLKNACLIKTMGHLLYGTAARWRHSLRGNGDANASLASGLSVRDDCVYCCGDWMNFRPGDDAKTLQLERNRSTIRPFL